MDLVVRFQVALRGGIGALSMGANASSIQSVEPFETVCRNSLRTRLLRVRLWRLAYSLPAFARRGLG